MNSIRIDNNLKKIRQNQANWIELIEIRREIKYSETIFQVISKLVWFLLNKINSNSTEIEL